MVVESRRAGAGRGGKGRSHPAGCGGLRAGPSRVLSGCGRREAGGACCSLSSASAASFPVFSRASCSLPAGKGAGSEPPEL